jgi:hypothetical protein
MSFSNDYYYCVSKGGDIEWNDHTYESDDYCLEDEKINDKVFWKPKFCQKDFFLEFLIHVISKT